MPLFSEYDRTDRRILQQGEDWFRFLDRVGPDRFFERVRELLDAWFDELATAQLDAFRSRLLSGNEQLSISAFWELYLHAALLRSGLRMDYEPALAGSAKRPDYLVHDTCGAFYLEARYLGEPRERVREDKLAKPLMDRLRELDSSAFTLDVQIPKRGRSPIRTVEIVAEVERWLKQLDRKQVQSLIAEHGLRANRPLLIDNGDWRFRVTAMPSPDTLAGTQRRGGAVAIFPGRSAWGGDAKRIVRVLKDKASRYGELGRPYVIALASNDPFADVEEIAAALFGAQDGHRPQSGLWERGTASRVSAVITARNLVPTSVAVVEPLLWKNTNASRPFTAELPFVAAASGSGENIVVVERGVAVHDHFGVDSQWPGPEHPFRD
jgi:hypothetical protein